VFWTNFHTSTRITYSNTLAIHDNRGSLAYIALVVAMDMIRRPTNCHFIIIIILIIALVAINKLLYGWPVNTWMGDCLRANTSPYVSSHHQFNSAPLSFWGPKTCKISVDFGPLQTLIANISGTAEDIQNPPTLQTMAIPPAFNEKSPWRN